ncbi:MAG: histidine kinase [Chloroflexi bacterium]|nr:histidine kinase [Chloroflexota bacterium]
MLLLAVAYVALWALDQSTDATLGQRKLLAQIEASHVDDFVDQSNQLLQKTAAIPELNPQTADLTLAREILRQTQSQMGAFSSITLLDSAGKVLWAEPNQRGIVGSNLMSHPAALRVFESREPAIFELPVAPNEVPRICLAAPIFKNDGALAGMLMVELDPRDETARLVPGLKEGDPMQTELVNGDGIVVASSYGQDGVHLSDHIQVLPALRREGVMIHEPLNERRHIVAYAPLTTLPTWGVIVEQPENILALSSRLRQEILIFFALAVVVGTLVAWHHVKRVVAPVAILTNAAARMGAGDLNSPVPVKRSDEVGVLANALEAMRSKLKDSLEERQRWNAELERKVEQRTKELSALLEATESLSVVLEARELWDAIMAQTKQVCSVADVGLVLSYEKEQGRLVPKASFGCEIEKVNHLGLQAGEGLVGKVFQSGWPTLVEEDTLQRYEEDLSAETRGEMRKAGLDVDHACSAICVPLATKQGILGCLVVYCLDDSSALTNNELKMLQAFAAQSATAIEKARLYEEVQRKEIVRGELLVKLITAQEEERYRIARELHDEPAQALAALMMAVENAEEALPQLADAQKQKLDRAKELVRRALGDVRRLIWDLRPTVLDDLGLAPAVRWFAEQRLENTSIDFDVRVSGTQRRLPTAVETEVYRIIQEAITNVARHAHASHLTICLEQENGSLVAVVQDDGIGFDVTKLGQIGRQRGLGLLGMQERASLLGGSMAVESSHEKGTRLTVTIPVFEGKEQA